MCLVGCGTLRNCTLPPENSNVTPRTRIGERPLWSSPVEKMLTVAAGQTHADVDFTVTMHPTVTGTVIGPGGEPVAGAEVGTVNRMGYMDVPPREFFCTRSAADGTFAMQVFASRQMREGNARLFVIARDAFRGLAGLAAPDVMDDPIQIKLQPAAWLLTRVVDRDGEPMPGVPIGVKMGEFGEAAQFERTMPGGVSDAEGFVRVGPIPPDADCAIEIGAGLRRFFPSRESGGRRAVRLAAARSANLLRSSSIPEADVTGTVLDADGQRVAIACLGDSTSPRPSRRGRTLHTHRAAEGRHLHDPGSTSHRGPLRRQRGRSRRCSPTHSHAQPTRKRGRTRN